MVAMLHHAALLMVAATAVTAAASAKRGLCYVPSDDHAGDDDIWDSSASDLTWYYNYEAFPSSVYEGSSLEFVPMLWGDPSDPEDDMSFYDTVANLIKGGLNVTYILGFNEPDASINGGSSISASDAATVWKKQFEPLKQDYGVKLGAPAVTGAPSGQVWMQDFFTACAAISNSTCDVDFFPIHWYGNFEGLTNHITEVNATYQNTSAIWVTEFACPNCTLVESEEFYNSSIAWLDDKSYVTHYSYFGAFRSDVSNVGPNAALLDANGELTDMGRWYLDETEAEASKSSAASRVKLVEWFAAVAVSVVLVMI